MLQLLVFAVVLILAFFINGVATPLLIRLSHKHKWYDFADVDAASIPLEIWASRVKDNLFVVQSISTSEGGLEWEELADYMVGNLLVVAGIVLFSFIGMVVFVILGIKTKVPRRRLVRHMGGNPA